MTAECLVIRLTGLPTELVALWGLGTRPSVGREYGIMAKRKIADQKAEDAYLENVKRKATVSMDMLDAARRAAQVYQRYYDGDQWTDTERRVLDMRGQPALSFNHIKPAVNAIIGIVERGRTDPKGWGRTPKDQDAAEVATDGLRYVADVTRYNATARECLQDFLVWGVVAASNEINDQGEPTIKRIRPEEFFYDAYSRDRDFSDARYMGIAKWMDEQDLIDLYPDAEDKIKQSFDYATSGDTFKDRPKDGWSWIDVKSRRIMCFEMYTRRGSVWNKCVFVYGGVLEEGASQYLDSKTNQPRNPIIAHSAYVDIENQRYGVVKDMVSPQDAINKGRSKAVHLLNVAKLRVSKRLADVDLIRREWAKPDGIIEAEDGEIEELGDRQLTPAHLELLRDAKEEMRRQSPTPGIVGRQGAAQSGRAILAEQQAGLTEQAPLLAGFDDWKLRCYRAMWESIKQFWTAPKWIRVTDDENAPRFVGLNMPQPVVDPMTGQQAIDPMTGQPVMQANSPAEMDVDIVIDSTPDTAVIQEEQFTRLVELVQAGMPIPPDVLIEASSLPKKRLLLDKLRQAQEQQQSQPDPNAAAVEAEKAKGLVQLETKQKIAEIDARAHAETLMRQEQADELKTVRAEKLEQAKFNNQLSLSQTAHENDIYKQRMASRKAPRAKAAVPDGDGSSSATSDIVGGISIAIQMPDDVAAAILANNQAVAQSQVAAAQAEEQAAQAEEQAQAAIPHLVMEAITSLKEASQVMAYAARVQAAPKKLTRNAAGEKVAMPLLDYLNG